MEPITLTKNELKALLACASKDAARLDLCGIGVSPSTGVLGATDGHCALLRLPTEGAAIPDDWMHLPREPLDKAVKLLGRTDVLEIDRTETGWTVTAGTTELPVLPASLFLFPPLRQVFPSTNREPALGVALSLELVARVAKAIAPVAYGANTVARWWVGGARDPVLVSARGEDGAEWRAVVMPCRI